jgi:hypothetical protein
MRERDRRERWRDREEGKRGYREKVRERQK